MDPMRFTALYERGAVTRGEVVSLALEAAAEHDPASFAEGLPTGCVDEIRRLVEHPSGNLVTVSSCCTTDPEAWKAWVEDRSRMAAAGRVRWRDYFANTAEPSVAPPGLPENG